jgi:hypothetical protein
MTGSPNLRSPPKGLEHIDATFVIPPVRDPRVERSVP